METGGRIAFLLLALGAAGAWWLNRQMTAPETPLTERAARQGYYMTEAELTRPGPDGLPEYRMLADNVQQESVGGPTDLQKVRVEYGIYTPTPWLMTAPGGRLSADQSRLDLFGGVVLAGEVEGERDTRVETDKLTIDLPTQVARTTEQVRLGVGGDWLTATGMTAYLMEERLQLQSSVHGQFLP